MGLLEKVFEEVGFPIGEVVRQLMAHAKMSEADLCRGLKGRGINLPQTTINRLLTGQTTDPRVSTLVGLAQFFEISLEQVLGQEMLVLNSKTKTHKSSTIPVVSWEHIGQYCQETLDNKDSLTAWIKTEKSLNSGSFALKTPVACYPIFGEGSVLVFNRLTGTDKVLDGQVALVETEPGQFCLRKVLREGSDYFLKRLFSPFDIAQADNKTVFHACLIESRNDKFSI